MFERALAFHRQGKVEDAARGYEAVLSTDPTHLDALIHLAVLHLGLGRSVEAEALLRRALAVAPDSPEAHGNLAATLQAMGRYDDASAHYRQALALKPAMLDARFGLAACSQALGRHDDAIACYDAILAADPSHAEANFAQGTLFAELGRVEEAIARYRAALAADADFAEASHALGDLLLRKGEAEEAVACFRQALDVDPDYDDARSALGLALYALGTRRNDLHEAVACLHEALQIDPGQIDARLALGQALQRLERDDEAMAAYRAVLDADPDRAMAHSGLAMILCRKDREAEGVRHFETALTIDPDHIFAKVGLASALIAMGRQAEAIALCRAAVASQPDFPPALSVLGLALAEMGDIEEATAMSTRAVALAPDRPEFCYNLARLYKVRRGDPVLEALEAALPGAASLSPREGCWLRFALAKAYDDIGERDLGFAHLLEGNAIRRREAGYDEANALGAMDRIRAIFTAEFLARHQGLGDVSNMPVFIVGMPRSGTTLVEQVLASHKAVFGAGERTELRRTVERFSGPGGILPLWEAASTIGGDELSRMGAAYMAALRPLAPDAARITDKMPANFHFAGLIHMILPKARIIHVTRDPVDTCLSCFSKLFTSGQNYSYDLAELGRFHRACQRLMAHWREVLPADVFLEVRYESLVHDLEPEARRMLAHCDLPWDDACLEFHKTSRAVNTASMTQVRQPIYRGSVGRWRPGPALLRPLLEALEVGQTVPVGEAMVSLA